MRLPQKRNGNAPSDVEWNCMVDCLRSLLPGPCRDIIINRGPLGTTYKPKASGAGGGGIAKPYSLVSVQDQYLTCNEVASWGATTQGTTDIYVLKPYQLWTTVITAYTECGTAISITYDDGPDSLNMARTKSDGSESEEELVLPRWRVGEFIGAVPAATGVTAADGSSISLLMVGSFRQWANA